MGPDGEKRFRAPRWIGALFVALPAVVVLLATYRCVVSAIDGSFELEYVLALGVGGLALTWFGHVFLGRIAAEVAIDGTTIRARSMLRSWTAPLRDVEHVTRSRPQRWPAYLTVHLRGGGSFVVLCQTENLPELIVELAKIDPALDIPRWRQ